MKVELVEGDITACRVDAIVNAANNHLWMGAGVAGAIKRAGGDEIESEALKLGPISVGEVAITGAGRLPARHVIHAAVMGQDLIPTADSIRLCTRSALRAAEGLKLSSIAFPALGTGVGGFAIDRCAQVMAAEVRAFEGVHLERVVFVLFGKTAFEVFAEALGDEESES
jgi:O-acetyl-ADP-ribose deacetylase (regulator of RNase III)